MISATTISIGFFVGSSTRGRAPRFSATSRFWIKVDSLKRPPTLLTICSSLNSSSIQFVLPCDEDLRNFPNGLIEVVVDDAMAIKIGRCQLFPRDRQALAQDFFRFRAAEPQSLFVIPVRRGREKDRDGFGIGLGDALGALHVDFQQGPGAGLAGAFHFRLQ